MFETAADGHRMQYVKWSAKALVDRSLEVRLVTTPTAAAHPLFEQAQTYCNGEVEAHLMQEIMPDSQSSVMGLWRRNVRYWRAFSNSFKACGGGADCVFVPYLDYCDKAISLLGSPFGDAPWAGLVMRPSFHLASVGIKAPSLRRHAAERVLFERLLRNRTLRTLFTIDEPLAVYMQDRAPELARKLTYVPDPQDLGETMSKAEARMRLGAANDRFVVLLYGSLTKRKGVSRLLEAIASPRFPDNGLVVMAGKPDWTVCQLLESPGVQRAIQDGKLLLIPRHINSEEEEMLFRSSDLVWLVYEGHYGSSGILSLAAAAGVPVLGCDEGLIGWEIGRSSLGWLLTPDEDAAQSITDASLAGSDKRVALLTFARNHSVAAFGDRIAEALAGGQR